MKRHAYPHFLAKGWVEVHEPGANSPTVTVQATTYISFHDEAYRLLVRDAKYRLELAGVPTDRLEALFFEGAGITELWASNPKGVRSGYGDQVEAFVDSHELKKRDLLIRQHRLVPHDQADMLQIYGPKFPTGSVLSVKGAA